MRFKFLPGIILSLIVTGCASIDEALMGFSEGISSRDPVTGERQINLVSEEEEIARAQEGVSERLSAARAEGKKIDAENPQWEVTQKVFNNLVAVSHRKNLPWEVHLLDDPAFNAFTIGGGKVFVLTGLFTSKGGVANEDELAAVLAHEIAHVSARHAAEAQGKLLVTQLADKGLRNDSYKAAFTTIQEDEADRYSVIYSALAGYDPAAGAKIWERLDKLSGSYTGNMLYDHPLNDDRARNLLEYSQKAVQYYSPGVQNQSHEAILLDNTVFKKQLGSNLEAGKGGGTVAFLEVLANSYTESLKAQTEENKRLRKQLNEKQEARNRLLVSNIQIGWAKGGGKGLFGVIANLSGDNIRESVVEVHYWHKKVLLTSEKVAMGSFSAYERQYFEIPLKALRYTNVSIEPVYVLIEK